MAVALAQRFNAILVGMHVMPLPFVPMATARPGSTRRPS
jgi:hypothetical protein